MTSLEKLTIFLAKKTNLEKDKQEVLLYGLQVFFYSVSGFLAVISIAYIFNCLTEVTIVAITVGMLRSLAGGAHCSTHLRCTIVTASVFPLLGRAAVFLETANLFNPVPYIVLISISALIVILLRAPVDSPAKPINTEEHRQRLRILSLAAVTFITILQFVLLKFESDLARKLIIAAGLGILWETFILTQTGHKFMAFLDNFLKTLLQGR